jgi:hypothetical protein
MKNRVVTILVTSLITNFFVGFNQQVHATPGGTVTLTDSGSTLSALGLSITGGVLEISSNVNLLPSEIESALSSQNLEVWATGITISSNLDVPSNKSLTLKSTGNITVNPGVNITSNGGVLQFWSDSDETSGGYILMGLPTSTSKCSINSAGGNVLLGGGADFNTGLASGGASAPVGSKPIFGIGIWGCEINAAGGNISLRGSTGSANSSVRAIVFENNAKTPTADKPTLITTGAGSVSIFGDASQSATGTNPWGPTGNVEVTTASGDITISGKSTNASGSNRRGLAVGNFNLNSTSGNITFEDQTPGSSSNNSGSYLNGTSTISTSGSIQILTDKFNGTWFTSLTVSTGSVSIVPYNSSFGMAFSLGPINATNAQSLTIGKTTNTANVTIGSALTVGGPLTIYGGNLAFNAATSTSYLNLSSTGTVTQSAAITASNLSLQGSGSFTLTNTGNALATVAAGTNSSRVGSLSIVDSSGGFEVGSVGSLSGIHSSGNVEIATISGNLTISQEISSSGNSSDSIILYADKDSAAESSGDGNLLFSGLGTVTIEATSRALLYSGSKLSSTGLGCIINAEDNSRMGVDSTTVVSSISPAVSSTGVYALFRVTNSESLVCSASNSDQNPTVANGYRADELGSVYFSPGSSRLSAKAKAQISTFIKENPAAIYKVTGYTQGRRNSKQGDRLAVARARAVETYLGTLGANVYFSVVVENGQIPKIDGLKAKSRRATLYAMTPVVL